MKPRKIYMGNNDVASILSELRVVLGRMGVETLTVTDRPPGTGDLGLVDYNFSKFIKRQFTPVRPLRLRNYLRELQHIDRKVWRKAVKECDVFLFKWSSFKEDFSDWAELKRLGKKVI